MRPPCGWRSATPPPLYRNAPETQEARLAGFRTVQAFMREALPGAEDTTRVLAGDLIMTVLSQVGKHFSEQPRTQAEIDRYAGALADMLCAYLQCQGGGANLGAIVSPASGLQDGGAGAPPRAR